MRGATASKHGVTPLARVVSWAHVGVDPAVMGIGPINATRKAVSAQIRYDVINIISR